MSEPLKKTQPMGIEEAIEVGLDWCTETKKVPSEVIAEDVVAQLGPDALFHFARVGWCSVLSDSMHSARQAGSARDAETASVAHASGGRNARLRYDSPLDYQLVAADGSLKRVRDFTAEDLGSWFDMARSKRLGWQRKERWAKATGVLLGQHAAATIGMLPKRVLVGVEKGVGKVFEGLR